MRLAWHIFRKDARRLWWAVALTLVAYASFAQADLQPVALWRGWSISVMTVVPALLVTNLLPFAWCFLTILVVHQEPLVGDRQFWLTRPYPRGSLVAAKAIFLAMFIVVPGLLVDSAILAANGFSPVTHALVLLKKQAGIAALLLAPAAALAVVVRTTTQSFLATIAVAYAGMYVYQRRPSIFVPFDAFGGPDTVIAVGVLLVLAAGCVLIVAFQYRQRRTAIARIACAVVAVAASVLYLYVPRETTFAASCALGSGLVGLNVRLNPGGAPPPKERIWAPETWTVAAIPIVLEGLETSASPTFVRIESELEIQNGPRWKTRFPDYRWRPDRVVEADLMRIEGNTGWLMLRVSKAIGSQITGKRLSIRGKIVVTLRREGVTASMPVVSERTPMSGLGLCSSRLVRDSLGLELIAVDCVSPDRLPALAPVHLTGGEDTWRQQMGDHMVRPGYFFGSPLSPLHRLHTRFNVSEEVPGEAGPRWLVPREALEKGRVEITPIQEAGCGVVSFELRDFLLDDYLVSGS